jgi:hypothetical protein
MDKAENLVDAEKCGFNPKKTAFTALSLHRFTGRVFEVFANCPEEEWD